ncbi:MAG: hypothetical protein N3G20_11215, partial [Verrucomicrobiae bacterium]|nr:hypothetical protein [Verrucomicrobiae bacterium]
MAGGLYRLAPGRISPILDRFWETYRTIWAKAGLHRLGPTYMPGFRGLLRFEPRAQAGRRPRPIYVPDSIQPAAGLLVAEICWRKFSSVLRFRQQKRKTQCHWKQESRVQ